MIQEVRRELITKEYKEFIRNKEFACVAAKAALAKQQIECFVGSHIACPNDDFAILNFLYSFIDKYRESDELYHSAAVVFEQPSSLIEELFDVFLWQRLQSLHDIDSKQFGFDKRVSNDPFSRDFSFSLKQEAFFVVGLHPESSRTTRQFKYPTLVFNPHLQFEQLRQRSKYQNLKSSIRKRDMSYSGSINPMLEDFGEASEVFQYSGRKYDNLWKCPLKINNEQS